MESLRRKKTRLAKVRSRLKKEGFLISIDGKQPRVSNMIVFHVVGGANSNEELRFRSVNPKAAKGLAAKLTETNIPHLVKEGQD